MSWDYKLFGRHLATRRFGREFVWHDEIDSTNRWLLEFHRQFTMSGGVAGADHQTAGRGRYQRTWFDRPGECLLFSVLFNHRTPPDTLGLLNLIPAVALAELLSARNNNRADVNVKWPNDVQMNGKKVAGILGQTLVNGDHHTTVVGVGINVNVPLNAIPSEIASDAGSLLTEFGENTPREILLAELLVKWEELYDTFAEGNYESICRRWEIHGPKPGMRLRSIENECVIEGSFTGIGNCGQLRLMNDEGKLIEIFSGDIVA